VDAMVFKLYTDLGYLKSHTEQSYRNLSTNSTTYPHLC